MASRVTLFARIRVWLVLLLLVGSAGVALPAAGQAPPANLSTEDAPAGIAIAASAAYGGVYRPGSWVPVTIELENTSSDLQAELRVGVERSSTLYGTQVDLPNGARKAVTVYVFVPTSSRQLAVSLLAGDEPLASRAVTLTPRPSREQIVGIVTVEGSGPALPNRLADNRPVSSIALRIADLPDQAAGLSSFDTLVFDDLPTSELSTAQLTALRDWVVRGGQLVIAGGPGAERTLAGLPPLLQPVAISGNETVPAAILFGADTAATGLTLAQATALTGADGTTLSHPLQNSALPAAAPWLFGRQVGQGSVVFFAAALNTPDFARWPEAERFWSDLLQRNQSLPPGFGPDDMSRDRFIDGNIASMLTRLPILAFPPLELIGGLLLAYIVLVGPVTYLVLRRLDRLALGWLVVPALTLVFAFSAYGLSYARRGGDIVLNQITLIEAFDSGAGSAELARIRSFVGLFSPRQQQYELELAAAPAGSPVLTRPISLQGPWDQRSDAQAGVFLQPDQGGAPLAELPVAQWSMRGLINDEVREYNILQATVTLDGDKLSAEVHNNGDTPLVDLTVVQGNQVAHIGDLAPGERRTAPLSLARPGAGGFRADNIIPLSYLVYQAELDQANQPGGTPLDAEVQLRINLLDALYGYGPIQRSAWPLVVGWSQQTVLAVTLPAERADQRQLTMVMATPRLKLAGSALTLDRGWFVRSSSVAPEQVCMGSQGAGFSFVGPDGTRPVEVTLQLPQLFAGLQADRLVVHSAADGGWPADAGIEVLDWDSGAWVAQETRDRNLELTDPARFLSSSGAVKVRITPPPVASNAGCVYVDAAVAGNVMSR